MANQESFWLTFRTKVLPTIIAASILSLAGASLSIYQKATEVLAVIHSHDQRLTSLEKEVTVVKSQMVGWDTLKRIELTLATLAGASKGNEAMSNMSRAIRNELEARDQQAGRYGTN